MNITVIYSTGRKAQSCTYNIARLLIRELLADDELFEFQLPRDMPHICVGCYACIKGQEQKCGGSAALAETIIRAAKLPETQVVTLYSMQSLAQATRALKQAGKIQNEAEVTYLYLMEQNYDALVRLLN